MDMTHGGNTDNKQRRAEIRQERINNGECVYCSPHGGCNDRRRAHARKPKAKK